MGIKEDKKRLTPRIDLIFKKIFGVDENKDLLLSLINSIVSAEDQIASVDILNPYNAIDFKDQKLTIVDIKARGNNGKLYNVEIQVANEGDYDNKALAYWAQLYTSQMKVGMPYLELTKTIGIHILNFLSIEDSPDYHHVFQLRDTKYNIHRFKHMELHTVELVKFSQQDTKEYQDASEALRRLLPKIKTSLDRWVTFLSKYEIFNPKELTEQLNDPIVEKAVGVMEKMELNELERAVYEDHLKWLATEAAALKKARDDGIVEGEVKKQITIAKNMLKKGAEVDFIIEVTGLTVDQLESLKNEP